MSLRQSLKQITEAGFNKMPNSIAKVLTDGIQELKANQLASKALQIGDKVPNLELIDPATGTKAKLQDYITKDLLVMNFYRGGWCPYCNLELRAYEQLKEAFADAGADIIAISSELPQYAQSTSIKNRISYPILTDQNGKLSNELGIGFQLNKDLRREYQNFGIDLAEMHGNEKDELMVPAVFVIDKDLNIVWAYIEENYMKRAEPEQVLEEIISVHTY